MDSWTLAADLRKVVNVLLCLSFLIGIVLIVSQEAFESLNRTLQKEYGVQRRLAPKVEEKAVYFVDYTLVKYRVISGTFIAVMSFYLVFISR